MVILQTKTSLQPRLRLYIYLYCARFVMPNKFAQLEFLISGTYLIVVFDCHMKCLTVNYQIICITEIACIGDVLLQHIVYRVLKFTESSYIHKPKFASYLTHFHIIIYKIILDISLQSYKKNSIYRGLSEIFINTLTNNRLNPINNTSSESLQFARISLREHGLFNKTEHRRTQDECEM